MTAKERYAPALPPRPTVSVRRTVAPIAFAAAACVAGGCASVPDDGESLAEEYARRESRQIDEASFRHARDRERLLGRRESDIVAAPPLDIDPARTDGWQFGRLAHPLSGDPVCAALSGKMETAPAGRGPRLAVLADGAFLIADGALAADRLESSVRIDSGLPIALDMTPGDRVAALRIAPAALDERLRAGTLAVVDVAPFDSDTAIEGVIPLDGLTPMLDELARCR